MTPTPRPRRFGFTLIELLVTIAVVAILAAMLLASISAARAKAHSIQCMSNLRQNVLGMKMAVDDDSGSFQTGTLVGAIAISDGSAQAEWRKANWGVPSKGSICPSAPERSSAKKADAYPLDGGTVNSAWVDVTPSITIVVSGNLDSFYQSDSGRRVGSYTPNGWFEGGWRLANSAESQTFRLESDLDHPAYTPVFGDGVAGAFGLTIRGSDGLGLFAMSWGAGPQASDLPAVNLVTGGNSSAQFSLTALHWGGMSLFTIPRHGSRPMNISTNHPLTAKLPGAINVAFYDGHVETTKLERLWSLYWHKEYVPPAKRLGL